jgi:hypothetical protein
MGGNLTHKCWKVKAEPAEQRKRAGRSRDPPS